MDRLTQPEGDGQAGSTLGAIPTRRAIVKQGMKLAFIAPMLSTFFAKDAYAARYSCYPVGHACGGPGQEPCCGTACALGVCPP